MRRHLVALVLAIAVGAAPTVASTCQIACAAAEATGTPMTMAHGAHACHHAMPAAAAGIGMAHACGHDDDLSVAAGERMSAAVSAAPVTSVVVPPMILDAASSPTTDAAVRAPDRPRSLTPLRI